MTGVWAPGWLRQACGQPWHPPWLHGAEIYLGPVVSQALEQTLGGAKGPINVVLALMELPHRCPLEAGVCQ